MIRQSLFAVSLLVFPLFPVLLSAQEISEDLPISEETEACLDCHASLHPGIVADWQQSRHSRVTPNQALQESALARRVSASEFPEALQDVVVGCAECHTLNAERHPDTFEHADFQVHPVVTPKDCEVCHPTEATEFQQNIMAHAYANLMNNSVYQDLLQSTNGVPDYVDGDLVPHPVSHQGNAASCLSCHGTVVKVEGTETRDTELGEMDFPKLTGWPNQGVGRINPDLSNGSCSACHTRHAFSIEMARKPGTCAQCHKGPDVPAYKVYMVSKHGSLYQAHGDTYDFNAVPWTIGEDFRAPTCATCHMSLLVDGDGTVVSKRTHGMSDRLFTRLFGLPYAHPHPLSPETSIIRNRAGLPLPTELTGEPAAEFLIDAGEQAQRKATMMKVCQGCHGGSWVAGHFEILENTIQETNLSTLTATKILLDGWSRGVAKGPEENDSIFNDPLEKMWVEHWLFYANSTRFAAAMSGADYGVYANGRWWMAKNLAEMKSLVDDH